MKYNAEKLARRLALSITKAVAFTPEDQKLIHEKINAILTTTDSPPDLREDDEYQTIIDSVLKALVISEKNSSLFLTNLEENLREALIQEISSFNKNKEKLSENFFQIIHDGLLAYFTREFNSDAFGLQDALLSGGKKIVDEVKGAADAAEKKGKEKETKLSDSNDSENSKWTWNIILYLLSSLGLISFKGASDLGRYTRHDKITEIFDNKDKLTDDVKEAAKTIEKMFLPVLKILKDGEEGHKAFATALFYRIKEYFSSGGYKGDFAKYSIVEKIYPQSVLIAGVFLGKNFEKQKFMLKEPIDGKAHITLAEILNLPVKTEGEVFLNKTKEASNWSKHIYINGMRYPALKICGFTEENYSAPEPEQLAMKELEEALESEAGSSQPVQLELEANNSPLPKQEHAPSSLAQLWRFILE
jgi:hypothetical protein